MANLSNLFVINQSLDSESVNYGKYHVILSMDGEELLRKDGFDDPKEARQWIAKIKKVANAFTKVIGPK